MNPEPPPIADPHSTAPAESASRSLFVEVLKGCLCLCVALLLSLAGGLVLADSLLYSHNTLGSWGFVILIWFVALASWFAFYRIIKNNARRKTPPS